jgi:hypothetical protein
MQKNTQICSMTMKPFKTTPLLLFSILLLFSFDLSAQTKKFKNLKSINVGQQNKDFVKIMFTNTSDEYFYATYRNVKIKKVNAARIDAKIRKADSVTVELVVTTDNAKQSKKLLKQARREFGKPDQKVFRNAKDFDWVWSEKKIDHYIESKSFHYASPTQNELKIILIQL